MTMSMSNLQYLKESGKNDTFFICLSLSRCCEDGEPSGLVPHSIETIEDDAHVS